MNSQKGYGVEMPRCKVCREKFEAKYFLQKACLNPACLAEWSKKDREAKQKKYDKVRKEALKTAGDYMKESQASINKYVRIRDKFKSCISCPSESVSVDGGYIGACGWDAGHYRSRGSASHLRFNLNNRNQLSGSYGH